MLNAAGRPGVARRTLRAVGGALLDAIIPRRCGLCGRFDTLLCTECAAVLPVAAAPRCPTCWGQVGTRRNCRSCSLVLVHSLAGVRSPYLLEEGARRLVHALKYDGLSALAGPMGERMAMTLVEWGIAPELVAPVPLHASRQRQRGFNQSALLARSLSMTADLPLDARLLRRTRATRPQVRMESAEARHANVAGAFAVRDTARVSGRTVLLLDDVCTTAATLRACADALRSRGAARVYALTFARD